MTLLFGPLVVPLLADAALNGPDYGVLAQYGALGVIAATLLWFGKKMVDRETARGDRLEAEVNRLNALIIDRAIPALTTAAGSVEEATQLMREMQRDREMAITRERALTERIRVIQDSQ